MEKHLGKIIKKYAIFTIIVGILYFSVHYFSNFRYFFQSAIVLLFAFFLFSVLFHTTLLKQSKSRPVKFTNAFMLAIMVKMFFFLFVTIILLLIEKQKSLEIGLSILFFYFTYTTYEIIALLSDLKKETAGKDEKKLKNN